MATNTYVALQTQTLSTDTATVTFSSIPQTYTDLVIVANQYVKFTSAGSAGVFLRFNGSSAAYYSATALYGTGSSALSARNSNQTRGQVAQTYTSTATTITKFNPAIIQIQNYSNTTTYKTTIGRGSAADGIVDTDVMLWRGSTGSSTEAITSIEISTDGTTFYAGSTFSLYGIAAATASTAKATGGTITYAGDGYVYHTFTSTGTFTPTQSLTADILTIAGGGGGGGSAWAGGGGGGGIAYYASQSLTATGYTCTVGGGGSGTSSQSTAGSQGANSSFTGRTAAVGGGAGGAGYTTGGNGGTGGSGGGAGAGVGVSASGGSATSGQGNAGGASSANNGGGGGGGAGAVGNDGVATGRKGGDGGIGSATYSSWGSATNTGQSISKVFYYAGGGAGGGGDNAGLGGYGGGGASASSGTANTGGGGGNNFAGGSGIVIVRYAG